MRRVTSRHNDRLRDASRLIASSRERRKSGRCVLEGAHLIDVYCRRIGAPETLVISDDVADDPEIARLVERVPAGRVLAVSRAVFGEIATLPPEIGVLAVVAAPRADPALAQGDFCVLLEAIQDPGNVGSIIRTAAAAGVDQVVLSPQCAFAWSPKVLRAGQGAHFLTTLVEDTPLDQWAATFQEAGGRVIATAAIGADDVHAANLRGRVAIAIGSEGAGLSAALCAQAQQRVTIPMAAGSESLNAAAAAAVVLFEAVRQRNATRTS